MDKNYQVGLEQARMAAGGFSRKGVTLGQEYSTIGKPLPRVDGADKASGQGKFSVDVSLPGMLHAVFLRSPHPHARILNIDTSHAERLPGVKAVITGRDTAGIRYAFVDTPRYPAA